jgi:hypothetical protein
MPSKCHLLCKYAQCEQLSSSRVQHLKISLTRHVEQAVVLMYTSARGTSLSHHIKLTVIR